MTDFSAADSKLKKLGALEEIIGNILDKWADLLISEIQKNAPKKTGSYSKSWKKANKSENSIEIITDQATLYKILEFTGRKPGKIVPKNAKVLHFEKNGGDIFAKYVNHPGFPPMPHVRPALKKTRKQIQDILAVNLQKI